MSPRLSKLAAPAFAAVLVLSAAGCSDDADDAADGPTTTAVAAPTDTDDSGTDDSGTDDASDTTVEVVVVKPLDEIDVCSLLQPPDIESVLGDETVDPAPETAPALPATAVSSEAEVVESAGCIALSSDVTDAGIILRLFRFPTADDAAAAAASLANGEELPDTQADAAAIARIDVPAGFSYVLAGSTGDVLVLVQAQSIPDLTDPATQVATLNGTITGLQAA